MRTTAGYSAVSVVRVITFHLCALAVFYVGWSPLALAVFVASFYVRHVALSAGYHRYFSHRSFQCGRLVQFLLALGGTTTGQRGPLSWATSHRTHHETSDTPDDPHSPVHGSWFDAQLGWILRKDALPTSERLQGEFQRFPEIAFLNRHYNLGFGLYIAGLYALGLVGGGALTPGQSVVWGGVLSTLLLLHTTGLINSTTHLVGHRPHDTGDNSRDLPWLFPLAVGESWHNSHHRYPWSANTALHRRTADPVYWILCGAARLGLVWGIKDARARPAAASPPPAA
jgi:stearoyl-CoA desaturase (delta-9 desaturase)